MMPRTIRTRHALLMNALFLLAGCAITGTMMEKVKSNGIDGSDGSKGREGRNKDGVRLICLVLTAPGNAERRDAIRNTWMRLAETDGSFVRYFVVGLKGLDDESRERIRSERDSRGDLLVLPDLDDRYEALAEKLTESLKLIRRLHAGVAHVIKCDDDSFVRLDALAAELAGADPAERLYWGYFKGNARVRKEGRWAEDGWVLCDRYLPYALGGGYVISRPIIDFVAANADSLAKFKSEDVAMGVWTAPLADLRRRHDVRFDTEWSSRGCRDGMLVRHKQSPEDMREMYANLAKSQGRKLCTKSFEKRPAYRYDWSAPPSRCCLAPYSKEDASNRIKSSLR